MGGRKEGLEGISGERRRGENLNENEGKKKVKS